MAECFQWSLARSPPPRRLSWSARPKGLSQSRLAPHCCSPVLRWPSLWRFRPTRQGLAGSPLSCTRLPPTSAPGTSSSCGARRQAVDLVHQLFHFAQIEHLAVARGRGHGQFAVAGDGGAVEAFELALDHDHVQLAVGQVLLRQVGARGDVALVDVVLGDGLEQLVETAAVQALVFERLEQLALAWRGNQVGTLQADAADVEARPLGGGALDGASRPGSCCRSCRRLRCSSRMRSWRSRIRSRSPAKGARGYQPRKRKKQEKQAETRSERLQTHCDRPGVMAYRHRGGILWRRELRSSPFPTKCEPLVR